MPAMTQLARQTTLPRALRNSLILALLLTLLRRFQKRTSSQLLVPQRLAAAVARCPSLARDYCPPWWATPLINSMAFAFSARRRYRWYQVPGGGRYDQHRERTELDDGGVVALDWACPPGAKDSDPILVMLHGVVGHSQSSYLMRAIEYHEQRGTGWKICAKTWRGIDVELVTSLPETWGPRATEDVVQVVLGLRKRFPEARLCLQGMSVGGCVALAASADDRLAGVVSACCAVSAPFDYELGMRFLKQAAPAAFGPVNCAVIVHQYSREIEGKESVLSRLERERGMEAGSLRQAVQPGMAELLPIPPWRSPDTFHGTITAPAIGVGTPEKYYEVLAQHLREALPRIQLPVLCVYADDDPVTPPSVSLLGQLDQHPWVVVRRTGAGGHCGWFETLWDSRVDTWCAEWFAAVEVAGVQETPVCR